MIKSDNVLVQVKISKVAYQYIKKYCEFFGGSLSQFCADAINRKIIEKGVYFDSQNETKTKQSTQTTRSQD